jgi:hypothetical protein
MRRVIFPATESGRDSEVEQKADVNTGRLDGVLPATGHYGKTAD